MQESTRGRGEVLHEGRKVCPREGKYKQERQRESTTKRGKVQESKRGEACKRGKAHAKEGKHNRERRKACMQERENLREEEKTIACEGKREGKRIHTQEREVYKKSKENCTRQKQKHMQQSQSMHERESTQ